MSSTEYQVDRRELLFVVNETLAAGKLCELPDFSEFDEEMFTMIINEASTFSEQVLAPLNENGDRQGCRIENGSVITPDGFANAWKQFGEGGWLSMNLPPEYGGQGLPEVISIIGKETQMAANQGFTIGASLTSGAANLIYTFGSAEQKTNFCEKMFSGTWSGSMCLTEPQAGTAVGDAATTATKQDAGYYLIKGTKQFITNGDHDMADNIIHLLLARTPDAPEGTKGISLFMVPKFIPDADGNPGKRNDLRVVCAVSLSGTDLPDEGRVARIGQVVCQQSPTVQVRAGEVEKPAVRVDHHVVAVGQAVGREGMALDDTAVNT